ncbi:hypothetical protein CB1_001183011 [Camelus ferus]|nr:hypothetical protein CB1_001183011 [Camelus ferus]
MLRGGNKASERRRHLSDRLSRRQDEALSSSIYLLGEMGPTAFLLREEEPENKDFRVTTAPNSRLVEGEISDLLRGIHRVQTPQQGMNNESAQIEEDGYIKQKEIGSDDICSICQEVLLEKKLPVTFCRKEFAPLKLILEEFKNSSKLVTAAEKERLDKHLGIPCNNCEQFPIEGKCYKVIHVRAGFDMDASHIFPQGVLATITFMGVWLVLKELEPIQDMTQDFLSAQW